MEGKREEIRKGPWKVEGDEILISHLKKYGLDPKWVQIFTGGKVSGDVKNFWSSRQKRLARILHHHQSPNHTKSTSSFLVSKMLLQRARSHQQSLNLVYCLINNNNYDTIKMVPLPDLVINPKLMDFDTTTDHARVEDLQISLPQVVPQPQLDITFSPGSQELLARFEDPYFFRRVQASGCAPPELDAVDQQPFLKPPATCCGDGSENPDAFFDDFPTDMFDQIEALLSPSHFLFFFERSSPSDW
ncbi:hypothetical protein Q3G72_022070 [Acer saccharum]|nr:hypothetical protein Q3G72_022070 [Acer saccharum]